jgi:hypothetical protein
MNQSNENSKYDTVNVGEIKALNGGKKNEKRVSIKYKNEKKVYYLFIFDDFFCIPKPKNKSFIKIEIH